MANLPTQIIKVSRPIHWVKNLALFAALIFSRQLFLSVPFTRVLWAFIAFNFACSAAYIFNDVLDVKLDRLHPIKKNRPIASGKLAIPIALSVAFSFAVVALYLSACLNSLFFFLVLTYIIFQIAYSLGLKNIAIIDILIIAAGFIIRVYAGAFVINAHLSVWFLLCVISVALFLASGKRRAELNLIKKTSEVTRKSLNIYQRELLNSYVTMFGNAAWMSWALYSFFESPKATVPVWLFLAELSRTTTISKMLMITIPIVIFGIMRYQSLIFEGRTEAPEKLLLTDRPLIISVFLYGALVIWILYGGVSVIA
ncbi:UbiA prenyltransferase family protein [Patescibacteria group bacterium]|nr:UbiA prenyltransferase family protein [Patescibacteria group bacterium]MBU0776730.1 UbiA prenyltransferase family protein [Patescibacteria group bacterium]MBU0846174.1 UbiA prenyltransferase family protein [Patescibacteria group bacterium]MBU0922737.1 UbiA prenyltransferase family protein [Patescibacteria group bacterium]MBU1066254.1 UbiA prenyltransferase family protein [Patescibacteria group bacterium]